jgi:hypothetical protein
MTSRLGLILMFEGDYRRVSAAIKNIDTFQDFTTGVLKRGDDDVTSTYINTSPSYVGSLLISPRIGDKATMPQGNYRYFISGVHGGKTRTWFWDVLVLPQDLSLLAGIDLSEEDYDPLVEEMTIFEGDSFAKELIVPGVEFTAADGKLRLLGDDVTATYCTGSPSATGETLTTHNIGAVSMPAGEYGYFITGTYNDSDAKSTWYWKIRVLPKQGVL